MDTKIRYVPPDGGYGWAVAFAYALSNFIVLPLISSFGLIFQNSNLDGQKSSYVETDSDTGLTRSQATIVVVLNLSFGTLISPFGGPVLSRFGYRKVAVIGAIFISAGLMMTSQASKFWQFILSYGIVSSLGVSAVMAAFTLAINSFFDINRKKAMGAAMSTIGLGAICMPLLIRFLKDAYGWSSAVLLLGALGLHCLVAACMLRPVKRYLKKESDEEKTSLNKGQVMAVVNDATTLSDNNGMTILPQNEMLRTNGGASLKSLSRSDTRNAVSNADVRTNVSSNLVKFFDLTLFTDHVFLNIMFGLSIAASVERLFFPLFPFILNDMSILKPSDNAVLMACIGVSETLFRILVSRIGDGYKKYSRVTYVISLFMLIFTRTMILFTKSFTGVLLVSLALGISKGVYSLCAAVVIPDYLPIHRQAYANGFEKFFVGIGIFIIGFVITRVRKLSGSYELPIILFNMVTFLTIICWCAEFVYYRRLRDIKQMEPQTSS